jgi:predicted membrane metal-binding protein
MNTLAKVSAFLALALAVVLVQLAVIYPGEYYPLCAILASLIFLRAKCGELPARVSLTLLMLTIAFIQARPLSLSLPGCSDETLRGLIREILWKKNKLLLLESDTGLTALIRAIDLPWLDSGRVQRGARVEVRVERCEPVGELSKHPPWSYQWYLRKLGADLSADAVMLELLSDGEPAPAVERVVGRIFEKLPDSDGLSVLIAATLGRGELLSRRIEELFRGTATTHLLVISGFHLAVVARGTGGGILLLIRRVLPRLLLFVPAPVLLATAAAGTGLLYGSFIGFSMTVSRALIALLIYSLITFLARKLSPWLTILYAFIAVQLLFPLSVFEPGCQLTFSALLGLQLGSMLAKAFERRLFPTEELAVRLNAYSVKIQRLLFNFCLGPLLRCLPVSLSTSFTVLLWFEQFVPFAAVINAIFIPIFSLAVICVGGISVLLFALVGMTWPLRVTSDLTELVIWFLSQLHRLFGVQVSGSPGETFISFSLIALFQIGMLWGIWVFAGGKDRWGKE